MNPKYHIYRKSSGRLDDGVLYIPEYGSFKPVRRFQEHILDVHNEITNTCSCRKGSVEIFI